MKTFTFALLFSDGTWQQDVVEAEDEHSAREQLIQRGPSLTAPGYFPPHYVLLEVTIANYKVSCPLSADKGIVFITDNPTEFPFRIRAAACQTADLLQVQSSSQSVLGGITAQGKPYGSLEKLPVRIEIVQPNPSTTPLTVRPHSPSFYKLEWQDAASELLGGITADGKPFGCCSDKAADPQEALVVRAKASASVNLMPWIESSASQSADLRERQAPLVVDDVDTPVPIVVASLESKRPQND